MKKEVFFLFLLLAVSSSGFSRQESTDESLKGRIDVTLSALVEPKHVPLNRRLTYLVRLSWQGDLDQIEMGEIEEPVLSNFEIIGSSASNQVVGIPDGKKAVKEIGFILLPKTLGMGYVEPVSVTYMDASTGKTHHLLTRRIGVEVVSPVRDDPSKQSWIWIPIIGAFLIISIYIFIVIRKRKSSSITEEPEEVILEEKYIEELKQKIDLKGKDRRESISALSRLFRQYLAEGYGISAMEATTGDLSGSLIRAGLDEGLVRRCESVFTRADVVKFSGQEATQAELDEAYTIIETILESRLADIRKQQEALQDSKTKKSKFNKKK